MKKFDGIIFDVDGVLIDGSRTFNEVNKRMIQYLFKKKFTKSVEIVYADIRAMRAIPGFNNDCDLSYALIKLLRDGRTRQEFKKHVKKLTTANRKSLFYQELVEVFETMYWGEKEFLTLRKKAAPFSYPKGLVDNEKLFIEYDIFKSLATKYVLGVATGRNANEVNFAFKKFALTTYIKREFIITTDDIVEQKPHPAPLLEAKKRMGVKNPLFVGDTINDVIAAKRAGMFCVYIGKEKLGDVQMTNVNKIQEFLL
jgi:HAD superfamily phosphatase